MHKQVLFGSPLIQFEAELPQEVNDHITALLLKEEAADSNPTIVKSNAGGWRSGWLNKREEICLQAISTYCDLKFHELLKQYDGNDHKWNKVSWATVNRHGDYNLMHCHPHSDWSCVYYVDSGDEPKEGSKATEKSGCLSFLDPRGSLVENSRVGIGQEKLYRKMFGSSSISLTPSTGLLVFFPSWLLHTVLPYYGDKPRISIAANYSLKSEG